MKGWVMAVSGEFGVMALLHDINNRAFAEFLHVFLGTDDNLYRFKMYVIALLHLLHNG